MKLRDRIGSTKKMFGIVTKQTNWKMRHPFYGLVCKFSHLFIRFKSFILFGSPCMYSLKSFSHNSVWRRENYSRTTSLSSASFILSITHRYLLYIRHSNFSHTSFHSHLLTGCIFFLLLFCQIHQTNSANKFVFPVRLFVTFKWVLLLKQNGINACELVCVWV